MNHHLYSTCSLTLTHSLHPPQSSSFSISRSQNAHHVSLQEPYPPSTDKPFPAKNATRRAPNPRLPDRRSHPCLKPINNAPPLNRPAPLIQPSHRIAPINQPLQRIPAIKIRPRRHDRLDDYGVGELDVLAFLPPVQEDAEFVVRAVARWEGRGWVGGEWDGDEAVAVAVAAVEGDAVLLRRGAEAVDVAV